MDKPVISQSLRRVVKRYVNAFAPERILLFGSYAKGTHHPNSDMDLLIVTKASDIDFTWYIRRARQLAADCFPRVDVVFVTPEEVKKVTLENNAFLLSALSCGIVLYPLPGSQLGPLLNQ